MTRSIPLVRIIRRALPVTLLAAWLFTTANAHAGPRIRFGFDSASDADQWTPLAGQWVVDEGQYVGAGPNTDPLCPSIYSPTYLRGFSASDLHLEFDVSSPADSVDRLVYLRANENLCSDSEIGINFRSDPYNDVAVQDAVDGAGTVLQFFPLSQPVGETLHVRVHLDGRHLKIWANNRKIVDQDFEFRVTGCGSVGLVPVFSEHVRFDNVVVTKLGASTCATQ